MAKVYIVEDDESIRGIVSYALQSAGFEPAEFENGEEFMSAIDKALPAIVLLDIMLPGEDGLTILKSLRASPRTKTLPVIMLTAKGSEFDKVKGLDMGADDYITKPFGVMELISRVGALLRRTVPDERAEASGIAIDHTRRMVCVDGREVELTFREYELLHYLVLNKGLALRRDKLMEAVWGYDFEGESRTLDMHIKSLRQKLGAAGECIKTIRNVGYKLEGGGEPPQAKSPSSKSILGGSE